MPQNAEKCKKCVCGFFCLAKPVSNQEKPRRQHPQNAQNAKNAPRKKMQYAILGFCIFLAFFGHYLMQLPPRTRQNDDAPGWQQVHAQPPSKRWAVWGRSLCCCSIDECSYPVQAFLFGLLPKSIGIVHASLRNSIKDNVDSSWNIMLGGLMVNLNIAKAAVHCVPSRFHMCNC